ncbi:MAG TPA: metal-binding protein [Planktothrix sp. UBA8407]|jgi:Predicted metal-binding, possibly nucleic acid-binding protein|nr:metal-binding protein [Planktothrix sp. UBA8407]HBK21529.1 metal-binding protein [Planktothrix sp. UBA10369]
MDSIYIPDLLRTQNRSLAFEFQECFPDLETLTPVRGRMCVSHKTTYIEVVVKAETIVTLTCDRCLKQYNHRLKVDTSELIWLMASADKVDTSKAEVEISLDEPVESLHPQGNFLPGDWLYQQLCLALPLRQLCEGMVCELPKPISTESQPILDQRWASLQSLKQNLQ